MSEKEKTKKLEGSVSIPKEIWEKLLLDLRSLHGGKVHLQMDGNAVVALKLGD